MGQGRRARAGLRGRGHPRDDTRLARAVSGTLLVRSAPLVALTLLSGAIRIEDAVTAHRPGSREGDSRPPRLEDARHDATVRGRDRGSERGAAGETVTSTPPRHYARGSPVSLHLGQFRVTAGGDRDPGPRDHDRLVRFAARDEPGFANEKAAVHAGARARLPGARSRAAEEQTENRQSEPARGPARHR